MQTITDVGCHREVGEEGMVLEHQADAPVMCRLLGNIDTVAGNRATMVWFKPSDDAE
jgi:hypothetical protein